MDAPSVHPNMADLYREKVMRLEEELINEEGRAGASDALRELIGTIVLTPAPDGLQIELRGNLAAMLRARPKPATSLCRRLRGY